MAGYNALNLGFTADGAITKGNLVYVSDDNQVKMTAGANAAVIGVAYTSAANEGVVTIQSDGIADVVASATIAVGAKVVSAADGKVATIASNTFDKLVGTAITGYTAPIAQVDTITIGGTFEADDVFTITVDGNDVAYTAISGDTNNEGVIDKLVVAINNDSTVGAIVEAEKATASTLTLTAVVPGTAFTATSTAVDGGSGTDDQTLARTANTANTAQVNTTAIKVLLK